jgi:hypothetical protein
MVKAKPRIYAVSRKGEEVGAKGPAHNLFAFFFGIQEEITRGDILV